MDWICFGLPVALIVALAAFGAWSYRGRARGGDQSTDPVANKGMAASFMGDMRRDSITRNSDSHSSTKRH